MLSSFCFRDLTLNYLVSTSYFCSTYLPWELQVLLRADNIHTHYVKHRHAKRARVIFLCDRSIRRTVYSNDLVKFFGCDVQHERNCEFMMYIRCYIGNGKP